MHTAIDSLLMTFGQRSPGSATVKSFSVAIKYGAAVLAVTGLLYGTISAEVELANDGYIIQPLY
jgi:hypothetical protein